MNNKFNVEYKDIKILNRFYYVFINGELELLDDAFDLWNFFEHQSPFILTGIPATFGKEDFEKVKAQKIDWVKKHFSIPEERIICCLTSKKPSYIEVNAHNILIDDTTKNISNWVNSGGIGIIHKNSEKTIKQYHELGL